MLPKASFSSLQNHFTLWKSIFGFSFFLCKKFSLDINTSKWKFNSSYTIFTYIVYPAKYFCKYFFKMRQKIANHLNLSKHAIARILLEGWRKGDKIFCQQKLLGLSKIQKSVVKFWSRLKRRKHLSVGGQVVKWIKSLLDGVVDFFVKSRKIF